MQHETLKAFDIRQPRAEWILRDAKSVEFRSQITKISGRVYIYTALGKPDDGSDANASIFGSAWEDLPKGVLVGTVEVVGCDSVDDGYEWQLADPKRLDTPPKPDNQLQPVWFNPSDPFGPTEEETIEDDEPTSHVSDPMPQVGGTLMGNDCTAYHAKLFAHKLLRRSPSDSVERFTSALMDSQVDFNQHQVYAALLAFRTPYHTERF